MVCTSCGAQILEHAFACPECARPLRVREVLESPPALAPTVRYKGVAGWLAFLVFYLLFLLPLGSGIGLVNKLRPLLTDASTRNGRLLPTLIFSVASFLAAGMGLYAGIALWKIYPNAVAVTKRFLVAFLLSGVATSAVQYHTLADRIWGIADALAFCLVWYAYLDRSKRVANTYPHSAVSPT
jgi:Protein of unknown function (DUF2569)